MNCGLNRVRKPELPRFLMRLPFLQYCRQPSETGTVTFQFPHLMRYRYQGSLDSTRNVECPSMSFVRCSDLFVRYIRSEDPVGHTKPVMEQNKNVRGLDFACCFASCNYIAEAKLAHQCMNDRFTIPFKYRPRSRPPVPLLTHDGIRPGCPIFHATIKRAPEVWFETLSILRCKPASGLAPVEVQVSFPRYALKSILMHS